MEDQVMIKLTPKQIEEIETISQDINATSKVLEIALNFCSNKRAKLMEERDAWWDIIITNNKFDRTKEYAIDNELGCVIVKEEKK